MPREQLSHLVISFGITGLFKEAPFFYVVIAYLSLLTVAYIFTISASHYVLLKYT